MKRQVDPGVVRYYGPNGKEEFLQALREHGVGGVRMKDRAVQTMGGTKVWVYVTAMTRDSDGVLEYVEEYDPIPAEVHCAKRLLEFELNQERILVQEGLWTISDIIPAEVIDRVRQKRAALGAV